MLGYKKGSILDIAIKQSHIRHPTHSNKVLQNEIAKLMRTDARTVNLFVEAGDHTFMYIIKFLSPYEYLSRKSNYRGDRLEYLNSCYNGVIEVDFVSKLRLGTYRKDLVKLPIGRLVLFLRPNEYQLATILRRTGYKEHIPKLEHKEKYHL